MVLSKFVTDLNDSKNKYSINNLTPNSSSGFTLTELLVALIISGVIIAVASAGLGAILNASRQAEIKNVRRMEMSRAISYINNEIKQGKTVEKVDVGSAPCDTNVADTGSQCLKITRADSDADDTNNTTIYYGFKDISSGTQNYIKPGVIRRRLVNPLDSTKNSNEVLLDGITKGTYSPTCSTNPTTVYGAGGFRFCVQSDKKRVQVYLYGYTTKGDDPITMNFQSFARSN